MNLNDVSRIASLVGEPSRTAMLVELMDGRALTANELAKAAGVLAPAASRHLAQLVDAGLLEVEAHGRHRYHRIASAEVARVLESIMALAVRSGVAGRRAVVTGPRDMAMRRARTCYDHVAGRLGVAIADRLRSDGSVVVDGDVAEVRPAARESLAALGLDLERDVAAPRTGSARPTCRPCLDWSERSVHLAGTLGTAVCRHCLDRRWLVRRAGGRGLDITGPGTRALSAWLGAARWSRVADGALR